MTIIDDMLLLKKYGYEVLPYGLAKTKEHAAEIAKKIGYPVALKVVSEKINHKSDLGGVKIRIKNEKRLENAYDEIIENMGKRKIQGMLVQKMARKGIELIVGGKRDPQFGHMIVVGLGGIYVEIFKDVSARICPVSEKEVREMIKELKAYPLLKGARGQRPVDCESLKKIVKQTCRLMVKENVGEIDLNPVIIDHKGCDIVDVRIRRE